MLRTNSRTMLALVVVCSAVLAIFVNQTVFAVMLNTTYVIPIEEEFNASLTDQENIQKVLIDNLPPDIKDRAFECSGTVGLTNITCSQIDINTIR